ncbi:MAG: hypothetical protein HYR96_14550 [Deltaproteobacteria bacterium]|nr:hypothetical protein [Deltaproteobacteria bacterium]MBI3295719.1 hypothetical protein [Deltaproteobacteria bacterium]
MVKRRSVGGVLSLAFLAKRLHQALWMKALIAVLCFQFALPVHLMAAPEDEAQEAGETSSPHEEAIKVSLDDLRARIERAGNTSARLALTAVQRNVGLLLNQELIDTQTGKVYDLTVENLALPRASVPAGLVNRALTVEKTDNGVVLGLKGNRYKHRISLNPGVELVDFDWDSDVVELLLSDGSRHVIEVSSLGPTSENMAQGLLFSAPIPVFYLGIAQSVNGKPVNRIRILQRRVDPVDRSRAAQLARLDRNPRTREQGLLSANRDLVNRVADNLELLRPVPLAPELEQILKTHSDDGQAWLYAGDTALIHDDGNSEEMVGCDSRLTEVGMIGLQMGPLTGLWHIASPESAKASKDLFDLRNSAKLAVSEMVSDPEELARFFRDGTQSALSRIPASALNATNDYAIRIAERVKKLKEQGTPDALRDAFTGEQQLADYESFKRYHSELTERTLAHEKKSLWNPSRYPFARRMGTRMADFGKGIASFDLPRRMRQVTTVLKKPLVAGAIAIASSAAATDYMANHGQNVGLVVDTVTSAWNHVQDFTVPIMRDMNYAKDVTLYSFPSRTAMMMSVFLLAAAAYPFTQHSINKLITRSGLKYLFSASIMPPQRFLAGLTLRPELVDAMKKGHFPRELLNPMGRLSSSWPDRLALASRNINDHNRYKSIASAIALTAIADRQGIDMAALLSSPELATPSSNLALGLGDLLGNSSQGTLFRALNESPEEFFHSLLNARQLASSVLIPSGAIDRAPGMAIMRSIVLPNILSSVGNFQEARYQALRDPQPTQDFSDYVMRGYLVDGLFSLIQSTYIRGRYADFENPDALAYQADGALWTNKMIWINDWEQIFLHLGASAAVDFLSSGLEAKAVFNFLQPASGYDLDRTTGTRSAARDGLEYFKLLFDLRGNNYLVGFGERSWNQCVRLLQGFFLIGMGLRLFEGMLGGEPVSSLFSMQSFEHATVGQLYFVFAAPFVYRWVWAVVITSMRAFGAQIGKMSAGYQDHYTQLMASLNKKDIAGARREADHMVSLYDREFRSIPQNIRDSLKRTANDNPLEWANRVLEACRNTPPVPEGSNEKVNKAIMFVASVATTYLAGFLMVDSFENRPFRGFDVPEGQMGFDTSDWFAWNGMSRRDSIPALMFKSLLNIMAIWGAGHAFNVARDWWAGKDTSEAVKGLRSMPLVNFGNPSPPLMKPVKDSNCPEQLLRKAS